MIVCTDCGHRNEDGDDFCGSCGAFLEFSGERTATTDPEPAAAPDPDDEARPTIVERVKAAVGLGDQPEGDDGGGPGGDAGGDGPGGSGSSPVADEAAAAAEAEALELRRRSDEEAQRRADEARRLADEATAAAQAARQAAEAEARRADEAEARQAAERAAREEAERAVAEAQEQVRLAAEAAERAAHERAEAEAAERDRAVSAEAVEAEREAAAEAARASAEAELARRAEAERVAREAAEEEARQRAEAEAREQAERAAREEAEAARRQAEEQAAAAKAALEEAEARARDAEQAARMAALVAKAKPAPTPPPAPVTPTPAPAPSAAPEAAGPGDDATGPGAGRKPEAVKPQRQRVKRPAAAATQDEVLNPGDLVCGSCGTGNDPQRRFCRRCGSSLVEAAVVAKPPWYRRIFRRRPKAKPEAGTRRDQAGGSGQGLATRGKYAFLRARSTSRKVGRIAALLALVGVAGLSLGPWKGAVGDQIAKVKRIISPEYEPVRPASASATSELGGHPAAAATDQVSNSYWAEGAEGTGEGQGLTFTFGEPVDLDRIGFLNGASEDPKDFVTQPRVRELQLLFDDGTTTSLTIKDEAEFQEHGIEARDVTTVQLQIISVYPSLDGSAASLAEVEFFRKE